MKKTSELDFDLELEEELEREFSKHYLLILATGGLILLPPIKVLIEKFIKKLLEIPSL